MKKTNLIKLFSILLIGAMLIMFSTNVFAAENNTFLDLTNNYASGSGNTNSNSGNTNTGNTNTGNTNIGNLSSGNTNTGNTNVRLNTNNTNTNTNNSSIYNNTNLPQTGIEDSIPTVLLIVVFGISAVYAYKKISDYRNI